MTTEAEAKEKWCPHAVASHTDPRAGVHAVPPAPLHNCIGSACMAWRWSLVKVNDGSSPHVWPSTPPEFAASDSDGFCGLAGRPLA